MKGLNPFQFVKGLKNVIAGDVNIPESLQNNQILRVLLKRRSVRKFEEKEISDDVLRVILEAARLAPSGVNMQSWSFILFTKETWNEVFGREIPFKGNKAVIICGDMHRVRKAMDEFPFKPLVEYTLGVINASIAAYAMNIAAESCGVSSVMLSDKGKTGFYDAAYLKEKLKLPDGVIPITTLVLGYQKGKTMGMPPKLPLEEIAFEKEYKEPDEEIAQSWFEQMSAGYRALYITKSFKGQIKHYLTKIDNAEKELQELVFYKPEEFLK